MEGLLPITRHCRFGPRKVAATSIRQARRARAHRRRQCQTLDETQLNGVLSQINPTFGLEAES